jgi:hypothetical protein
MAAELGHSAFTQDHASRAAEMGPYSIRRWYGSLALYALDAPGGKRSPRLLWRRCRRAPASKQSWAETRPCRPLRSRLFPSSTPAGAIILRPSRHSTERSPRRTPTGTGQPWPTRSRAARGRCTRPAITRPWHYSPGPSLAESLPSSTPCGCPRGPTGARCSIVCAPSLAGGIRQRDPPWRRDGLRRAGGLRPPPPRDRTGSLTEWAGTRNPG